MAELKPRATPAFKKPAIKRQELHFYPGARQLIWLVNDEVKVKAEAWGGESPIPGFTYSVMPPRQTTPGKYVIHSYAPYRTKTWIWSTIAWGTRISVSFDKGEEKVFYETGQLSQPWKPVEGITKAQIESNHLALYGTYKVPETWVFNDFGAMSVRYFKDLNNNKKLDKGETLSGEMIHTTPGDEARTARSMEVSLQSSHGCIHVKPNDRDRFYRAGAFTKGNDFIIHGYAEPVPEKYL
ncbi:MAG: hypothetical protein LUQ11_00480 [Methylococcaceae bacterium]|nr:hypothetical protein [Methylococcaceae bacterium]